MSSVLIIDDEYDIRELIADTLIDEGYTAITAHNIETALHKLATTSPKVVVLDIWLEGNHMDGIGLLRDIKKRYPTLPVIMISGHANTEIAVQTIKLGAYDFIEKPFKSDRLLILVKRAIEAKQLSDVNNLLRYDFQETHLIGNSKAIATIREQIKTSASSNSRVIIIGESGVGKGVLARSIHNLSKRCYQPFIHVRTYNKNSELIEQELFSGENYDQGVSALERANGGTLFIEEIANLPMKLQLRLLDVVQNGFIHKNGEKISLDIRFITSSSNNIEYLLSIGELNETLYSRLSTVNFFIPALRDRKQDIELLSEYFCKKLANEFASSNPVISDSAYSLMMAYDWPGNIRQLRNAIERLLILANKQNKKEITSEMLSYEILNSANHFYSNLSATTSLIDKNYKDAKRMFEKEYLKAQLLKFNGNIARTAGFIGMDRAALHRKLKVLQLSKHIISNAS